MLILIHLDSDCSIHNININEFQTPLNTRQNERHRGYASIEANYFDDSERMDNRGYARMTSELL